MTQQTGSQYIRRGSPALARAAIACVWLYQGLWCKLLSRCPSEVMIVRSLPGPLGRLAGPFTIVIGAFEVVLALWVLSGRAARPSAVVQTALLILMNGGGFIWGRALIVDPAGTLLNNFVLLALAWTIAGEGT